MPPRPRGGGAAANAANAPPPAGAAQAFSNPSVTAMGPSKPWFVGAPVTKLIFFAMLFSYVALHSHHWNQSPLVQGISTTLRHFTYPTLSEFITSGSLAMVWGRTVERTMGSKQLVRLFVVTVIVAFWVQQLARLTQFHQILDKGIRHDESHHEEDRDDDPSFASYRYVDLYLGMLFWFYHRYTPRLHPRFVSLRGTLHCSEKALYYLWFLYCATLASRNSAASSNSSSMISPRLAAIATGALAGVLFPTLSRFAIVPDRLSSIAASRIGPLLQAPPRLYVPTFGGAGGGLGGLGVAAGFTGQHGHYRPNPIAHQAAAAAAAPVARVPRSAAASGSSPSAAAAAAPIAADPGAVETLVGMGFERQQVVQALQATRNDVQSAANLLLASA
jgi:UBA/TS-N domain